MLIGVFDLIRAKTEEYDAWQSYLEAVRDYWLARVDLMQVVGARLPSERQTTESSPSVSDILTPTAGAAMPGLDHSRHGAPAPAPAAPAAPDHSNHGGRP
jgi:cobalt-zinc-cadmium efflux system outer membrane protein